MKTQYFRRSKRPLSPFLIISSTVLVGVVFLALLIRFFAPSLFVSLVHPLWDIGTFFTEHATGNVSIDELTREVTELRKENEQLKNDKRLLLAKKEEGEVFPNGILAGVFTRPPVAPYDVLIVGKGTDDGVYKDMRVFSRNVPIGTVESTSGKSARVLLYSTAGRQTEGWIGEKRVPVTLVGRSGGVVGAEIPREAAVKEGDMVYVPGPGALPYATVVRIETHPSSPRAVLTLRPFVNIFSISEVLVTASPAP